ncbi:thioesterase family protein [Anaerosolibacter sp.]|uniref:thioesterase family protein n=1 Tax=Anaerosolibacter sp. TaxID=1872527 RepID=UPI0039EF196B
MNNRRRYKMEFALEVGMKAVIEHVVGEKDTAVHYGSGGVLVYATPAMIGLMENASLKAVDPHLPKGYATVGTHLDVKHMAATPVGMMVRAEAELIEADGKKLTFRIDAYDEKDKIGEGFHSRYIIHVDKFIQATASKGSK